VTSEQYSTEAVRVVNDRAQKLWNGALFLGGPVGLLVGVSAAVEGGFWTPALIVAGLYLLGVLVLASWIAASSHGPPAARGERRTRGAVIRVTLLAATATTAAAGVTWIVRDEAPRVLLLLTAAVALGGGVAAVGFTMAERRPPRRTGPGERQ
jgi:hypothetical protein